MTFRIKESSLPQFPTEVIKGFSKDFVSLYKNKRQVPDELIWAAFMAYFGNLISPYARLSISENTEPRLYLVNLGRSGQTKKSTALNLARDFIRGLFPNDKTSIQIVEGFGSAEGLVAKLAMADREKTPTMLHLDEVNVLAQKTGMDNSVGISVLNKLFEDQNYEHPLRDSIISISNARLSLVGASTIEDYQKVWSGKHKDTGFFSRLFLVPAEPSSLRIAVPVQADINDCEKLRERVRESVLLLKRQPVKFHIDDDARRLFEDFYAISGDGDEWNRIDTYAFRFMTLQAVVTGAQSITKEIMEDVIKISNYQTAARISVSPIIAENQCAMVEQLIRRALPEGTTLSRRNLQRKINADRYGIKNFDSALKNLVSTGELNRTERGKTVLYTRFTEPDDESNSLSSVITIADDSCISSGAA